MSTKVRCPNPECGRRARISEENLGQTVRCPRCGISFVSSLSDDESALPPAVVPEASSAAVIGRYQIRDKVGKGAFGTVFQAYDPKLDRMVALKVLHPQALTSQRAVERFQREARAAARMLHPHIVPVYDAGQHGERSYITSAFISGCSLAAAIPEEGLEVRRAVRLALQLTEALGYAHQQGVLHRDVKPANILLDEKDHLFLTDFGLAGWTEPSGSRLTRLGATLGTPSYMAPEMATGDLKRISPASDVYSAGVVLYEMLTGQVPFEGPVEVLLYQAIETPPPPPSQFRPGLDSELEAICLKALAKKPEERFAGAQEMAEALREWLSAQEPEPPRPQQPVTAQRSPEAGMAETGPVESPWSEGRETVVSPSGEKPANGRRGGKRAGQEAATMSWWLSRPRLVLGAAGLALAALVGLVVANAFRNLEEKTRQLQKAAELAKKEEERKAKELGERTDTKLKEVEQRSQEKIEELQRQQAQREKEEADRKAKEEAEKKAKQEAEKKAKDEQRKKEEEAKARLARALAIAQSMRLERETVVTLLPGRSASMQFRLNRSGYTGEIRLQVSGLPRGVQVAGPIVLSGEQETARIELKAAADAPEGESQLTVTAMLDGVTASARVRLQVRKPLEIGSLKVTFETVDGVRIEGAYYPSLKLSRAACVLLLHDFDSKGGGSSRTPEWNALALSLQKAGYAVLSFDFRGFGESTAVSSSFWKAAQNQGFRGARMVKPPATITSKDYGTHYYRQLVNDVAAARDWLDDKNDNGLHNSRNVIVLGAGQGATVGLMWMATEFKRHRALQRIRELGTGKVLSLKLDDESLGDDLRAGVWLSLSPTLGGYPMPVGTWCRDVGRNHKLPMALLHGEDNKADPANQRDAEYLKVISPSYKRGTPIKETDLQFSGEKTIAARVSGSKLLQANPDTARFIIEEHLESVSRARTSNQWRNRDNLKGCFFWVLAGTPPILARDVGESVPRVLPAAVVGLPAVPGWP